MQVNGVISTGKEANVYHGTTPPPLSEGETEDTPPEQRKAKPVSVALKIYKTSILSFKDRHTYISGEYRFRHGYSGSNPRKMVKMWAEKEARNLKRLGAAGIRAPKPLELRENVLVMEFLGKEKEGEDGWASKRLKDAEREIDEEAAATAATSSDDASTMAVESRWAELYREMVAAMRTMWWACRLVHADLSEYNVLYHLQQLYIIDVSQSVEHDHPRALDFLRADISHVESYFSKRGGVKVLGLRKVFDWILKEPVGRSATGGRGGGKVGVEQEKEAGLRDQDDLTAAEAGESTKTIQTGGTGAFAVMEVRERERGESEEELMADLKDMMLRRKGEAPAPAPSDNARQETGTQATQSASKDLAADDQESDAVFRSAYIPRTLNEVYDPERDIAKMKKQGGGGKDDLIYGGMLPDQQRDPLANSGATAAPGGVVGPVGAFDEEEGASPGSASDSDEEDGRERREKAGPRGHRHEPKDVKKQRKQEVKAANAERRKEKAGRKQAEKMKSKGGGPSKS